MAIQARVWAPVATFAAVLAVGGAAVLLGGSSGDGPARLPLASGTRDSAALAAGSGSGTYRVSGTLPTGTPPDAPAFRLASGPADAAVVARLAAALGDPAPVRDGQGWRAGGLVVSGTAGQSWYSSACAPDTAVSPDTAVGCAVSAPAGQGAPATDVPQAVVLRAATPVLAALGLTDPVVTTSPYGGSATVTGTLGGQPVAGLVTRVDVDARGSVTGASGHLGAPSRGDDYPLVSAQQALDALPAAVSTLECPVGPDGKGCVAPAPPEVTGAHLGLSLQQLLDGSAVLVPSWLFDLRGSTEPLVAVAVDPSLLGSDTGAPEPAVDLPASTDPAVGGPSGSGSGSSSDPGVPEPAPATEPVALLGARASTADNAVTVLYEGGGCGRSGLHADVKEDAQSVYVQLLADVRPEGQVCTMESRPSPYEVALQDPLGSRTVVDATTSKPVRLS